MRMKLQPLYPQPTGEAREFQAYPTDVSTAPRVLGVGEDGKLVAVPYESPDSITQEIQTIVQAATSGMTTDLTDILLRLDALENFNVAEYNVNDVIDPIVDLAIIKTAGITVLLPVVAERKKPVLVRCDAAWFILGSGELIEGDTTFTLYEDETLMCANDGTTWRGV